MVAPRSPGPSTGARRRLPRFRTGHGPRDGGWSPQPGRSSPMLPRGSDWFDARSERGDNRTDGPDGGNGPAPTTKDASERSRDERRKATYGPPLRTGGQG